MKEKSCKVCKEKYVPQRSMQQVCTVSCGIILSATKRIAKNKKKLSETKRKMKTDLETHSDLCQKLQPEINKIARLIDENCRCISCGTFGGKKQGGHYKSV